MRRTFLWRLLIIIKIILIPNVVLASKCSEEVPKAKILHKAYRIQIPFIENQGQIGNDEVRFYAKTFGGTLFVKKDGTITYSFASEDKGSVVIKEIVTGKKIKVKGLEPSPTRINYFKGMDKSKWKTNIPSYNSVSLGEIYKGIDLTLKAYSKNVEKLFTVSPGAHPEKIAIKLEGAKELKANEKGELVVITELGPIKFTKPIAYQEIGGKKVEVDVDYHLLNLNLATSLPKSKNPKLHSYNFKVGNYDKSYPLLIDPLLASTYIGGGSEDGVDIQSMTSLDKSGNVYITGYTSSSDFPTAPGAYDESFNGDWDIFVSKLDGNLSTLFTSTFVGGHGDDDGVFLTIDGNENVYVTGCTKSSDFPTTPGTYDETYNGGGDVFVSKLNTDLSDLLASTYIGGGVSSDCSLSLFPDGGGNVYITGYTSFSDFPTTPGAYDKTYNGYRDVFVSKLDGNLSTLFASTFVGGNRDDDGVFLTIDGSNNVYETVEKVQICTFVNFKYSQIR